MDAEKLLKPGRGRWYVAGALAGVGLAVAAVVFLFATFAKADDMRAFGERTTAVERDVGGLKADRQAESQQRQRLEEDYHFLRDQTWEIAKRVGAAQLPAPHHDAP